MSENVSEVKSCDGRHGKRKRTCQHCADIAAKAATAIEMASTEPVVESTPTETALTVIESAELDLATKEGHAEFRTTLPKTTLDSNGSLTVNTGGGSLTMDKNGIQVTNGGEISSIEANDTKKFRLETHPDGVIKIESLTAIEEGTWEEKVNQINTLSLKDALTEINKMAAILDAEAQKTKSNEITAGQIKKSVEEASKYKNEFEQTIAKLKVEYLRAEKETNQLQEKFLVATGKKAKVLEEKLIEAGKNLLQVEQQYLSLKHQYDEATRYVRYQDIKPATKADFIEAEPTPEKLQTLMERNVLESDYIDLVRFKQDQARKHFNRRSNNYNEAEIRKEMEDHRKRLDRLFHTNSAAAQSNQPGWRPPVTSDAMVERSKEMNDSIAAAVDSNHRSNPKSVMDTPSEK